MVIQNQSKLGEGSIMPTDPYYTPTILQPSSSQPQKTQKPRRPTRNDTQVPQPSGPTEFVIDEAVHKELGDRLVRATTTAYSLEAKQDSGNITKTQSKETPNESSSQGTDSGGGPRCQNTIGDTTAQTRILDLELTKTTRYNEIDSLKRGIKKLEKKNRSRAHKLKRLYKVGLSARVESSGDKESLGEDASKQERMIDAIDADEDITLELGESLVRDATTASSLEAKQDNDNINKTQSKETPNESSSQGNDSGCGPRGNKLRSDKDSMKLNELMELCTNLQNKVLDLEKTRTSQRNKIDSLKRRVKKLEKRNRSRTHKLKRLYKERRIDADDEITLVNDADNEMFDVDDFRCEKVFVAEQEVVSTTATTKIITTKEITLAQALEPLKTLKPMAKGIVFQEPGKSTTTTPTISSQQSQDNGKRIMIEEPVKSQKKDQIMLDEEAVLKLQAEFDEEERLARERELKKNKKPTLP
nr:hypothetical protein [Tanacetum cinerariifolium]